MRPNEINQKLSLKTLRGPFNIYPQFFFKEDWDKTWVELFQLSPHAFTNDHIKILEKSPLAYLEEKDKQVLLLSKLKNCIENLKIYRNENSQSLRERILKEIKVCHCFIEDHFNNHPVHSAQTKNNRTFILLAHSYLAFCEALLESGNRSRKTMAVAHSFILELKDEGILHPYFSYYEALLLIGRNKWNEATSLLHKTLKENSAKTDEMVPLANLLCKLYVHLNMPHVASFVRSRYFTEEPVKNWVQARAA